MASSWLHQERYDDELIGKAKVVQNLKMQKKDLCLMTLLKENS